MASDTLDFTQLAVEIAKLKAQLNPPTVIKRPDFRGKTNTEYAVERAEVRHHGHEVHARRMAKQIAKLILAQGMANFYTLNNCKYLKGLLKQYGVAETHWAFAIDLVKALVEGK